MWCVAERHLLLNMIKKSYLHDIILTYMNLYEPYWQRYINIQRINIYVKPTAKKKIFVFKWSEQLTIASTICRTEIFPFNPNPTLYTNIFLKKDYNLRWPNWSVKLTAGSEQLLCCFIFHSPKIRLVCRLRSFTTETRDKLNSTVNWHRQRLANVKCYMFDKLSQENILD